MTITVRSVSAYVVSDCQFKHPRKRHVLYHFPGCFMAWCSERGTPVKAAVMSYLMSDSDPAPQRLGLRGAEGTCPVGAPGLHAEDFEVHPSDEQMHLSKKVQVIRPTVHGTPFSEPHFRAGVPSPQATEPSCSC